MRIGLGNVPAGRRLPGDIMIRQTISRAALAALLAALALSAADAATERQPRESYAQCKQRISSGPPCNKWTRECAKRCGFSY